MRRFVLFFNDGRYSLGIFRVWYADTFLGKDMQKDTIVTTINPHSAFGQRYKRRYPYKRNSITTVNGKDRHQRLPLDIGLIDTMKDLR